MAMPAITEPKARPIMRLTRMATVMVVLIMATLHRPYLQSRSYPSSQIG
jgi:hypothetical protein